MKSRDKHDKTYSVAEIHEGVETEQIMFFENQEYMEWNSDQLILRMHDGPHSYTFED